MNTVIGFFASERYWEDAHELQDIYEKLSRELADLLAEPVLIKKEEDLDNLKEGSCLIIIPMSGAVQKLIIRAASKYFNVILYPTYVKGNTQELFAVKMLNKNAAPTLMDCWAVLRRTHDHAELALCKEQLSRCTKVFRGLDAMQGAKILLIGKTEPWVISNSEELSAYERWGVTVEQIEQAEVASCYRSIQKEEAMEYYHYFRDQAKAIIEPTEEDILASCRMSAALVKTIIKHGADGIALACFKLLEEGTNSCLGVSYINDCTPYFAACEGDMDSAITMLAMAHIAGTKLWMANPGLHPEGIINFSHCTAPLDVFGTGKCPYIVRNHHESGIGTSLQVEYPIHQIVTACRISAASRQITIQKGVTVEGEYECACRTQMYVKLDNFQHYIETALGCHQVFAFEDIEIEMKMLAKHLKLEYI